MVELILLILGNKQKIILDNHSIVESKCPECCPFCKLEECADPEICPQPEPREPKGNYASKERKETVMSL